MFIIEFLLILVLALVGVGIFVAGTVYGEKRGKRLATVEIRAAIYEAIYKDRALGRPQGIPATGPVRPPVEG